MKRICSVAIIFLLGTHAFAQDPLKSLPQAYKLQFENEWVKVTRVRYAPREKLSPHQHTESASAYVYLNDSGPVVFKHIGLDYGAVTRPATKARSFRLFRGLKEIHSVENLSDLPSEFLRVEFKTEPINDKALRGRFYHEDSPAGENFSKVQFENEQVRITRLVCAAGKTIELSTGADEPALLVALSVSSLREKGAAKGLTLGRQMGQTEWLPRNLQLGLENTGRSPAEFLRFDFKTKPLSQAELDELINTRKKSQ